MSTDSLGSDDQEEEEDNTDSDEELDSPKCILQQPQEKMDVDVEGPFSLILILVYVSTEKVAVTKPLFKFT